MASEKLPAAIEDAILRLENTSYDVGTAATLRASILAEILNARSEPCSFCKGEDETTRLESLLRMSREFFAEANLDEVRIARNAALEQAETACKVVNNGYPYEWDEAHDAAINCINAISALKSKP